MIICERKSYRYSVSGNSVFLPLRRCGHIVRIAKSLNHGWNFFTQKSYIQFLKNHKSLNMLRLRSVSSLRNYIEYYCYFQFNIASAKRRGSGGWVRWRCGGGGFHHSHATWSMPPPAFSTYKKYLNCCNIIPDVSKIVQMFCWVIYQHAITNK